jgi:hypothetical protein
MSARKPTAADMVERVGTVEQRLPRRKPSLPAIAMEGATKGRVKAGIEPVAVPERREVFEETVHVGAGADRTKQNRLRVSTPVERMYNAGGLTWEEYAAGGVLRNRIVNELGGSEGVSSYGDGLACDPWGKADRRAVSILSRNRSNTTRLAGLLYAMAGVEDDEGKRVYDRELATLVIRACTETVDGVTLAEVGKARSEYANGSKQQSAAGSTAIREALRRGAIHLRYAKAVEWRDATSWRVLDSPAK